MTNIEYCLPKDISPQQFLSEYWQKKPLLIKQGLPQLVGMFEPDDILGLCLDELATARLITQYKNTDSTGQATEKWHLQQSPLSEKMFDALPDQWTVLVQNLEQWSPELGILWNAFNFIPQWQRDDIMVSYAPKNGSVGKHYDDYDVFLAQGYGHRRWQLGKYCDEKTEFMADQPIRIFDDMGDIIFDEILSPGDVLYVPPKLSHYGVATDDCLTFSFGFRRPNMMQILDSLVDTATSESTLFIPLLLQQSLQASGQLDTTSITEMKNKLLTFLHSEQADSLIQQAISEVVSKRQYDVLLAEDTLTEDEVATALEVGGLLRIDYSSRLIYTCIEDKLAIFANGQLVEDISDAEAQLLKRIADAEAISLHEMKALQIDIASIMNWLENGWVWLDF